MGVASRFVVSTFCLSISILRADKILRVFEILFLEVIRLLRWVFHDFVLRLSLLRKIPYYARAPTPFTSFERPTRGVTLCEFCHADNSNTSLRGNIVFVFRFHVN